MRSVLAHRLHERPVVLQLPLPNESSSYSDEAGIGGVIDIMRMEAIRFSGRAGEVVQHTPLSSSDALFAEASRARHALVETLAGLDDVLLDALLSAGEEADAHMALPADQIRAALRRQVLKGEVVPVLCGAAARNIGVQPVLDAIVDFLPSPADRATVFGMVREDGSTGGTPRRGNQDAGKGSDTPAKNEMEGELAVARDMEIYDGRRVPIKIGDEQAAALAFKVMWDRKRGPMTFVRVYSGMSFSPHENDGLVSCISYRSLCAHPYRHTLPHHRSLQHDDPNPRASQQMLASLRRPFYRNPPFARRANRRTPRPT